MQVNKKGEIVNAPKFQVSGDERIKLKKKLAALKRLDYMFWIVEDCNRVYGCGISDEEAKECMATIKQEISDLETILNQKL